jgi:hypothetical protein
VAEAEGRGRKLVAQAGVDVRVVASIGLQGSRTEERGQELLVGDGLQQGAHQAAGTLVDRVAVQSGIAPVDAFGEPVVLAHEQGVECGQTQLLVGAHVTGQEHQLARAARGIGQRAVVVRQQIAGAGGQPARTVEFAQGQSAFLARAVDVRAVDADLVLLLARVRGVGPRLGVVDRAVEGDEHAARGAGVEVGVAGRHRDVCRLGRVGSLAEVDVVVQELPPLPQVVTGAEGGGRPLRGA